MAIFIFHTPGIKLLANGPTSYQLNLCYQCCRLFFLLFFKLFHMHLIFKTCYQITAELKTQTVNSWAFSASAWAKRTTQDKVAAQIYEAWLWKLTWQLGSGAWPQLPQDLSVRTWPVQKHECSQTPECCSLWAIRSKPWRSKSYEIFLGSEYVATGRKWLTSEILKKCIIGNLYYYLQLVLEPVSHQ